MSVDFELNSLEKEFMDALQFRQLERLVDCIEKGVSLHFIAGNFEERPLHFAAQRNAPEIIELLVARGARIDVLDQQGQTPLFHATDKGSHYAAMQLLQLDANPNHVAYTGRTAIFSAASRNDVTMIELLAEAGADPNFEAQQSRPLFFAINQCHYAAAKALVKAGARLDVRDSRGLTPAEAAQQKMSDYEPSRLLAQFLSAAQLANAVTGGAEENVSILKPLSLKLRR